MTIRIKIQSSTLAKLQLMADHNNIEIGESIDALLGLASAGHWFEADPVFQDKFIDLLETSIDHVKSDGWSLGY